MFSPTGEKAESSSSTSIEWPKRCNQFTIHDIQLATENFDESLVIGRGGFGKVYKGSIVNGASHVVAAIKRLDSTSNQGAVEFRAEVEMLTKLRHSHLVSLLGYCNDGQEMILVYEYMPRGTLEDHLHKCTVPLSWMMRLKICIGAARGLDYLHAGTGIGHGVIHRDVKSSNILLNKSWAAKISDFGLSKIGPTSQHSTPVNSSTVKGTFGYLDPDYYYTGRLTIKSDVYSFGVLLFENLCGKRAVDESIDEEQLSLARWAQDSIKKGRLKLIVDSNIRGQISRKCLKEFARLADSCLDTLPKQRPTMAQVVVTLESILALQEKANNTVHPGGMTIFGRRVPMFLLPSNDTENSGNNTLKRTTESGRLIGGAAPGAIGITVDKLVEFPYEELAKATDEFSHINKIGQGGFGPVYYGELRGEKAAIKKMDMRASKEFLAELKVLAHVHHLNLVRLIGYCVEESLFLVYEFIENGNLSQHLRGSPGREPLQWATRVQIALDSARVLEYIHEHTVPVYIHRDIKPPSILIDQNFRAKVAGFGLAKLMKVGSGSLQTRLVGTFGYMAPEYAHYGEVSPKADVYAFGVVLFELISAKEAVLTTDEFLVGMFEEVLSLPDPDGLCKLVDPRLGDNYPLDSVRKIAQLGRACTHDNPQLRPSMRSIVVELMSLSSSTEDWDVGSVF